MASGKSEDPQTFNRYIYVGNDPLLAFQIGSNGAPSHIRENGLDRYLQRVTNAQGGNGFRTSEEVAAATFWIWYGYKEDGTLWTRFSFGVTNHYRELAKPRGGLNDKARALIKDMGRRGPVLLKITTAMGAGSLIIIAAPVVADLAVAGGVNYTAQAAINNVISNAGRLKHIFEAKHLLQPLLTRFGSQAAVVHQVINALNGRLPANGIFRQTVNIAGYNVVVTGRVVMGTPYVSNFWIPMGPLR